MKFDQVWFWRDLNNTGDAFYGLTKEENYISMVKWDYHENGDYGFARAEWKSRYHGTQLPRNEDEFWRLEFENNANGWSVCGSRTLVLSDLDDDDQDIFREFEDMYDNADFVDEAEWGVLTNITEVMYGKGNDMLDKIIALNKEVDDFIAEVQKQIDSIEEQKRISEEGAYGRVKDFLDELMDVAREISCAIEIKTGTGYMIYFWPVENEIKFVVPDKVGCSLRHTYYDTINGPRGKKAKDDLENFICNWDEIQKTILSENFYKGCTEKLTKKVNEARKKLEEARK